MEPADGELIARYVRGDATAFADLARRYAGLVYGVARRRVSAPADAEDVTQAVFMVLAAKARSLRGHATIGGWLVVVTRRTAMTANRAAARRARHERRAAKGATMDPASSGDVPDLERLLDDALSSLNAADRDALTLRYLHDRSLADVGRALHVGEDAARKRVDRALVRLRTFFTRNGVTTSAGQMTAAVAGYAATPAPAVVVERAVGAARMAASPLAKGVLLMMSGPKIAFVSVMILFVAGIGLVTALAQPAPTPPIQSQSPVAATAPLPPAAPQPGTVNGRVLADDGTPVGGAVVTLTGRNAEDERVVVTTTRSGPDGRFTVGPVTPGPTYVSADSPGVGCSPSALATPDKAIELRFAPAADARLTLLGPDGRPAAGVRIWPQVIQFGRPTAPSSFLSLLMSVQDHLSRWAVVTGADGTAVIHGLPQGGRFTPATDDLRFARLAYEDGVPVEADPGRPPAPIRLQAAATIEGRVTYADTGKPAAGVALYAQNYSAGLSSGGPTVTDADGHYRIGRVKAGRFVVCLASGKEPAGWCAAAAHVTLREGGRESADLRLIRGGLITGRVRDATTGAGLPDMQVGAYGPAHPKEAAGVQSETTDANGLYTLRVPPGESSVYLMSPPPPDYAVPEGSGSQMKRAINVEQGQTATSDFDLRPDTSAFVTGTVLDEHGRPVPHAIVTPEGNAPIQGPDTAADENGRFRIKSARDLVLRARADDKATLAPVTASPGARTVTLTVSDDAYFQVTVTVIDESGHPMAAATAALGSDYGTYGLVSSPRPVDRDGRMTFERLFTDTRYTVHATAPGFGQTEQPLDPAFAEAAIVLRKADQTISGVAVDDGGRPIADAEVGLNGAGMSPLTTRTDGQGRFRFPVAAGVSGRIYFVGFDTGRRPLPNASARAGDTDVRLVRPADIPDRREK